MTLDDIPLHGQWTIGHIQTVQRALASERDPRAVRTLNGFLERMTQRPQEPDPRCRCQVNFATGVTDESECPIHD